MAGNANSAGKRRRPIRRPLRTPRDRMRAIWPLLRPSNVSLSRRVRQRARDFRVSQRTIYRWLGAYRRGGRNALRDGVRADAGIPRAVSRQRRRRSPSPGRRAA